MTSVRQQSNFSHLKAHDEHLDRLALLADYLLFILFGLQSVAVADAKRKHVDGSAALDDPDLIFKREDGGFNRLDKIFNGQFQPMLAAFNDTLWVPDQQAA